MAELGSVAVFYAWRISGLRSGALVAGINSDSALCSFVYCVALLLAAVKQKL